MHALRQFYVVVAVDSEYLLNNIALPVNIDHVSRRGNYGTLFRLADKVVLQGFQYLLNGLNTYLLADEVLDSFIIQFDFFLGDGLGIVVFLRCDNLTACNLCNKGGGPAAGECCNGRVCSPFVAERCISLQSVGLGSLAD